MLDLTINKTTLEKNIQLAKEKNFLVVQKQRNDVDALINEFNKRTGLL